MTQPQTESNLTVLLQQNGRCVFGFISFSGHVTRIFLILLSFSESVQKWLVGKQSGMREMRNPCGSYPVGDS